MKHAWKLTSIIIALTLLLSLAGSASPAFADDGQEESFASDRLIIQFDSGTSWSEIIKVHQQVGGKVVKTIPQINSQIVTVPKGQKSFKMWVYRLHSKVRCVEPDYVAQVLDVPNDPYFNDSYQWGMFQTQAPQAWDITHGSSGIRIAILDTGVDSSHPDLGAKVVAKENFTSSDTAEPVNNSHGTHVAGIAAAISNNGIGVAGLGYDCSLMNVKVAGDDGYGYYSWIAQGIIWATDNGADVINLSLGGTSPSSTLEQAVNYAWDHGVVVVAAAGNDGSTSPLYPAYYDKCLAVAATNDNDQLTSWSSHGNWVDVAAPGSAYSTKPDGQYGNMAGTSMASPHVAGLAGLVFSVAADTNGNGRLNDEVRATIEATCDDVGIDVAYGRINAYHAVGGSSPAPTGQISGTVTAADNGKAIYRATVTAGTTSVTTNSKGNYTISNLPEGSYTVTASANDYQDASQTVTVAAGKTSTANFSLDPIPKQAPVLNPIGNKTVDEGNLLQFTISASDPDGDTLTYSASNLPKAASFSPSTRTFTWTPDYDQAGIYHNIHFEVSDGSLTDSKDITITVNDVPLFGQISGTVTAADSGKAISGATVTAGTTSVTTNSKGNYTISNLPEGTYTVTASANDYQDASQTVTVSAGKTSTANFSLDPIPNQAPVLNPIGNKTVDEGNLLQFTISASDPDGDTLTYSASNLPKAASFSPSTRTFTWIPDYEQAGIYHNIHFEVSDGSLTDSKDITITVNDVSLFFAFLDHELSPQPVQ